MFGYNLSFQQSQNYLWLNLSSDSSASRSPHLSRLDENATADATPDDRKNIGLAINLLRLLKENNDIQVFRENTLFLNLQIKLLQLQYIYYCSYSICKTTPHNFYLQETTTNFYLHVNIPSLKLYEKEKQTFSLSLTHQPFPAYSVISRIVLT